MTRTRNTLWLTGSRLTGDVLNLLLFVLISRRFGPSGVGVYSYGFAVATFAFVIGCLGIEEYGLRQYARMDDAQRPAFLGELLGTQAFMVAAAVFTVGVYLLLTRPPAATLILIGAFSFYQITAAVVATLFIPAMAAQRMLWPALAELCARTIAFAGAAYAMEIAHAPLALAALGFPCAAVVWIAIALRAVARFAPHLRLTVSWASARRIVAVLWSFALLEVFAQLFARIGVISLSLGVGDAAAGVFATGLRLIEVALMPLSFLGVAAYPALSQLFATDLPTFRRSAVDLLWLMLQGGGAVAWGLYFVAPALLVPVLGARFAGAEPVIQAMALFALVQAIEVGLGRLMLCTDRQSANAWYVAGGSIVSVILNVLLVPRYGVNGAIFAGAVAYAAIDVLCVAALRGPLTGAALWRMLASLGASLAVGGGLAALLALGGFPAWPQALGSVAAFIGIGAVAYRYRRGGAALGAHPRNAS